jgi:hypothetical protein
MNAQTARAHAARLGVPYDRYLEALTETPARYEACAVPWPPSLHDVAPARCQLLAGHVQRDGTPHQHRVAGSKVTAQW